MVQNINEQNTNAQTTAVSEHIFSMLQLEQKLQHADRKQARLYLFCNFMALMIISAYTGMMFSPTVQTAFPTGGDSRKQMNMIFILTLLGCVIFTIYAACLFFRHKSSQLGILMALGASRKRLMPGLFREVILLSSVSSIAGIVAGFPFIGIIWNLFRLFLIDSSDMKLSFDFRCLLVSLLFLLLVMAFSCLTALRYLHKTNIMEVIREEHINEPVKELGKWCGAAGAALLVGGILAGYFVPIIYAHIMQIAIPPAWLNLLWLPAFVGLYMIMLHAVVHGVRSYKKNPYKNLISRSIMKFQGKQTVNNMIIVTLLLAGACFGIFYLPVMLVNSLRTNAAQPYDYLYYYRADQQIPDRSAIEELASKHHLTLKDWGQFEYITLGYGGNHMIMEEDGNHYHKEYWPILTENMTISQDTWNAMTGESLEVPSGTYFCVTNRENTALSVSTSIKHITNMVNRRQRETVYQGLAVYDFPALVNESGCRVISNEDYAYLSDGLTDDWKGAIVQFNIDGKDSYPFANALYHTFVATTNQNCLIGKSYDRVYKIITNEHGEEYFGDNATEPYLSKLDPSQVDSLGFRLYWKYQPSFRILEKNDFLLSTSVFLMMFLFIFIVCLLTALVICYTRCQTIALNNRYIFDDLKKLGASPAFLAKEVRSQCSSVFQTPSFVGLLIIYLFFALLLYSNDGKIIFGEIITLFVCLGIEILTSMLIYGVYRGTVSAVQKKLGIIVVGK